MPGDERGPQTLADEFVALIVQAVLESHEARGRT
jgi:hypothetical protein